MSDAIPDEAFPERMKVFSRHRKMTFNDHVNRDPVDWCDYIRKDIADAAVKAERERCAERFANHDFICMKHYAKGWRHDVYDAIRTGEQP
jgi:hypothetical protein